MRCPLCPSKYNCIPPDGPKGDILICGEAPGIQEEGANRVFVGKTGQELDKVYLPQAGLKRNNVRISNAIRCLPDTSGHKLDPKNKSHLALLKSCSETNLYPEIRETSPKLLIPMGSFACRAIDPEINLELHHGFPVETRYGTAFPMYHPAQGIHEPKKMMMIGTDWYRLKQYLAGKLHIPVDKYPNPDYAEATASDIACIDPTVDMACDTESSRSVGPYCLTYSQYPGHARLIRAQDKTLLSRFQAKISRWHKRIFFHNWLYDWKVVEGIGLEFPISMMRDTMERCFLLGNIPQGLKALAYRELGMDMTDYEDVVLPHSRPHVIKYYEIAQMITWPKPEPFDYRDDEGEWKTKKPQSMNTKLKRFFTDLEKDPDKDVFGMWDNWTEAHEMIEAQLGQWPGSDIDFVPWDEMLHYACRDADADIRLNVVLESMMRLVRKLPQEKWREQWNLTPTMK